MARLLIGTAEINSVSAIEAPVVNNSPTLVTDGNVISGVRSFEINGLSSGVRKGWDWQFITPAGAGPYYARGQIRFITAPNVTNAIFSFTDATLTNLWVNITTTGTLTLNDGGGVIGSALQMVSGGVYNVVIKFFWVTTTTSQAEIWVNDVLLATAANRNLVGTVFSFNFGGNLRAETATTGRWIIDNTAVNDTTGSNETYYPTFNTKTLHLVPTAAGDNTTWTRGGTDSGANWSQVDENPPNDATDYVYSNTLNQIDDYRIDASSIPDNAVITLVAVGVRFAGGAASANASFVLRLKDSAGNLVESAAITPADTTMVTHSSAAPKVHKLVSYTRPTAGTPWTKNVLANSQIGVRLSATSTNIVGVTTLWLVVEYTTQNMKLQPIRPRAFAPGLAR